MMSERTILFLQRFVVKGIQNEVSKLKTTKLSVGAGWVGVPSVPNWFNSPAFYNMEVVRGMAAPVKKKTPVPTKAKKPEAPRPLKAWPSFEPSTLPAIETIHSSREPKTYLKAKKTPKMPVSEVFTPEQKELIARLSRPDSEVEDPDEFKGIKNVGLPITQAELVKLVHTSLSTMSGSMTQLRPHIFTNIFQSAPVVASYIANAFEAGFSWQRIERFLAQALEPHDKYVRGIRILAKGNIGEKVLKKRLVKKFEHGSHSISTFVDMVDYGNAVAQTRMGTIGIKVWIRYYPDTAPPGYFQKMSGFRMMEMCKQFPANHIMSLGEMLAYKRDSLQHYSASTWWHTPAPLLPVQHCTWQNFVPDFDPTSTRIADYASHRTPLTFDSATARAKYIAALEQERLQLEGAREAEETLFLETAPSEVVNDESGETGETAPSPAQ